MVWFQCEDCGDNLKKPKLLNHFRCCSAYKLSCIDCGEVFGQHNVESHTQCITEAEKYGPKGQGNVSNGTNGKPQKDIKQKPEVDINVGLSERPPWFCSLCNTNATSKQTLLLHADGKKHRGKARGFHAAKQQATEAKETKNATENNVAAEAPENKEAGEIKTEDSSKVAPPSSVENGDSKLNKKRKHASENNDVPHKDGSDVSTGLHNGEVVGSKGTEAEVKKGLKKAKHSAKEETAKSDPTSENGSAKKKIKWKKLITSALQSNPDGVMKFKKLAKFVVKSLEESGFTEDKKQVPATLEQTINSSSRFVVDGKYVRLATSS